MEIRREWAMPNKNTFDIKPIREFIERHARGVILDPFANRNRLATITNDINPEYGTDFCMDALDFLRSRPKNSADTVLFDPPFSQRQIAESYKSVGMAVNMETTQSSYWKNLKEQIARIVKEGGGAITCAWNSGGIGEKYGFRIEEILLVPHGGWHNDTIVVYERKVR